MPARIRQALWLILILVLAGGLYWLINGPGNGGQPAGQAITAAASPDGFAQLLAGQEFSDVVYSDGIVYAGGVSGLYQIDPHSLAVSEILLDGQSYQSVRSLDYYAGELWIGHEAGLSVYRNGELVRRIGKDDNLPDARIQDILRVDQQTVYAATYSGLAVISPSGIRWLTMADGLPGISIKVLMQDSRGDIWIGSYDDRGGGVAIFTAAGDLRQTLTIDDGLVHNSITSICEKDDGQILVGGGVFTAGGASLLSWQEGRWQVVCNLGVKDGLIGEKVRQIFLDHTGNTWFCSEYDGVAILNDRGVVRTLTRADGLSDNEVKQVSEDDQGFFWLATRDGLTRIRADIIPE